MNKPYEVQTAPLRANRSFPQNDLIASHTSISYTYLQRTANSDGDSGLDTLRIGTSTLILKAYAANSVSKNVFTTFNTA